VKMRALATLLVVLATGCTFGLGEYDTSDGPRDYGDGTETSFDTNEPAPSEDEPKRTRKVELPRTEVDDEPALRAGRALPNLQR
jgi:hypothetical protein